MDHYKYDKYMRIEVRVCMRKTIACGKTRRFLRFPIYKHDFDRNLNGYKNKVFDMTND